jgi:WD40 repeat protein
MSETFAYDGFLSHSTKDKPAVRRLAERLKKDGLRVWFDAWAIQPGDLIGLKIEQGLEQSRTLVLVMSKNTFASEWVTLERHTALFRDPTNIQRRFIPLRLDNTEIKDTLKQFAYIDWRKKTQKQYTQLLAACRPALTAASPVSRQRRQAHRSKVLKRHNDEVNFVAITPDGRRAVSGSSDCTVRVWALEAGQYLATLEGHTAPVIGVAVTADGRRRELRKACAIMGFDRTEIRLARVPAARASA